MNTNWHKDSAGTVYLDARLRECVTVAEAARRIGCSASTLMKKVRDGTLPCTIYEGRQLVPIDALGLWRPDPVKQVLTARGAPARTGKMKVAIRRSRQQSA